MYQTELRADASTLRISAAAGGLIMSFKYGNRPELDIVAQDFPVRFVEALEFAYNAAETGRLQAWRNFELPLPGDQVLEGRAAATKHLGFESVGITVLNQPSLKDFKLIVRAKSAMFIARNLKLAMRV